jgi:nucleoside-diphosphate-sugar epimerase
VKSESNRSRMVAAVTGTQFLMEATLSAKMVRKVMGMSSEAAFAYGHPRTKLHINEEYWTNTDVVANDYSSSKVLAEKLVWDMVPQIPQNVASLTICPHFGPLTSALGPL